VLRQDIFGVVQFLKDYPGMSIAPSTSSNLVFKGSFSFTIKGKGESQIVDSYQLKISVPATFPKALPKVFETDNKIPRNGNYHVNYDNTLCLGSPLRLMQKISQNPTLVGFSESCLVPYLYAVSFKLQNGGDFIFSELAHGRNGIIADYLELFSLKTPNQVMQTLNLLGMKQRIANKKPCPCGCGNRLAKCSFHKKLNSYRKIANRNWFRKHFANIGAGM